jgi:hypothetical protein
MEPSIQKIPITHHQHPYPHQITTNHRQLLLHRTHPHPPHPTPSNHHPLKNQNQKANHHR